MAYPHISISHELDNSIREYATIRKIKYSQAVTELINYGVNYINENKNYEINQTILNKILGNEKYIITVLEQFYSDMYMEAKTNPNNNEGLKTIKNKFYKRDFDD